MQHGRFTGQFIVAPEDMAAVLVHVLPGNCGQTPFQQKRGSLRIPFRVHPAENRLVFR